MSVGPLSDWPADTRIELLECSVGGLLCDVADAVPERMAVCWPDSTRTLQRLSYRELLASAKAGAAALLAEASPGDRVAVWAPNGGAWVVAEFAVALAGMVLVPLNPALTDAEASYILASSGAVVALAVSEVQGKDLVGRLRTLQDDLPALRAVRHLEIWQSPAASVTLPVVDPAAPFLVQYTSGTTGRPKGAVLSHRAVVNAGRFSALSLHPGAHEVWCTPLPLHHVGASVCHVLAALSVYGGIVVLPRFDAALLLELIEEAGVTHVGFVPTMCVDLLEHPRLAQTDLSSLRTVMIGGTSVPPQLIRRIETSLGVTVLNGYGQSESPNISQTLAEDTLVDKAQSIGRPLPHRDVRIRTLGGVAVAPLGEVGELLTRSPLTMSGYFGPHDPPAVEEPDAEGWLHTGDLCSMDARGVLRFHGRLREVIIRGGENIYPREIEEVLLRAAGVADVAVVGGPDARMGERVVAFVRCVDGVAVSVEELTELARGSLAGFKVPVEWHLVDELPLTPSGKVRKFLLKELVNPS
jgi:fatty-acyl-CoA synthase